MAASIAWFEARGPQSCLLTLVDDATGRSLGRFGRAGDDLGRGRRACAPGSSRYGIPRALYTDWKNVYVRRPNAEERATGAVPLTQFGRMCAALGIQIIPASSPQAKGRVERNHGTHQDRLVKKLRRHGDRRLDGANAFLEAAYWADHNARFRAGAGVGRRLSRRRAARPSGLDTVFRLEEKRTVSNDWVVRYDNRCCSWRGRAVLPPARSTVLVCEAIDGTIEIRYRDRVMRWTEHIARRRRWSGAGAAPVDTARRPRAPPQRAPIIPWRHVAPLPRPSAARRGASRLGGGSRP